MTSPAPIIAVVLIMVIAIAWIAGIGPEMRRRNATRMTTFQARIVDKMEETSMIYTGVFIPLRMQFIVLENGVKIQVKDRIWRSQRIGDTVPVSIFSDGSYRLDR